MIIPSPKNWIRGFFPSRKGFNGGMAYFSTAVWDNSSMESMAVAVFGVAEEVLWRGVLTLLTSYLLHCTKIPFIWFS